MPARPFVDIMFGPYKPDLNGMPYPENPGYLTDCVGLRMTPNGYRGLPQLADISSATVIGSASFSGSSLGSCFSTATTTSFFFVYDGDIFESRNEGADTWQDVTPAAGSALSSTGNFARFGDDVILIGPTRPPVVKTLTDSHATLFTDLGGSPPQASYGARVRNHLVLGGLSTDEYAVQWSAIGDHEDWPTPGTADARSKQAGRESLNPEYGQVQAVLGGEKIGIIAQERAITRMTYVGGATVYEFDTYERAEGYRAALGVSSRFATDGSLWYWYNENGVFATDGYSVKSLSEGVIDEAHFFAHSGVINDFNPCTTSAYDAMRGLVIFAGSASLTSYQLVYDVTRGAFSFMNETNISCLFPGGSSSRRVYNVDTSDRKLQKFGETGVPTIALQTGYIELDPGYRFQLQGAHLLGEDTSGLTLSYQVAQTYEASNSARTGFNTATAASLGQKKNARISGQCIAFRVTGTGSESQLIRGIRVYFQRAEEAT